MPSLDGKYEAHAVLNQGDLVTTYQATGPEGQGTIYWFEVHDPTTREAFYRYRNVIKELDKSNLTSKVEISSKPGYYYIFWPHTKGNKLSRNDWPRHSEALAHISSILASYNYTLDDAELKAKGSKVIVTDLNPLKQHSPTEISAQVPPAPSRGRGWQFWLPGLLMSFLAAWTLGQGIYSYMNPPQYLVPDLRGMDIEQVKNALADLDLEVVFDKASDPTRPTGVVLDQDPPPNTQVRAGRRIELALNQPRQGEVPRVLGLTIDQAEQSITSAGYRLGAVHEVYAQAAPNSVIATSPTPGTTLPVGSQIELLVSGGPSPATTIIPDLRGLTVDEARFLLTTASLQLAEVMETVSDSPPGVVIDQTPAPGIVAANTAVHLTVAARPQVFLPPPRPAVRAQPSPISPETENQPTQESVSQPQPQSQAATVPPPAQRTVPLQIRLPDSLVGQEVRLMVRDQQGIRVLYDGPTQSGWRMEGEVPVVGQATFRLVVGGELFQEWTY